MDTGTPKTAQPIMPLPPKRTRQSPRARRVVFEPDGDGRLLSLIRNATFISHGQLVTLATRFRIKAHPDAVRKRIVRYIEYGLVRVIPAVPPHRGAIYQITRVGLRVLESFGIGLCSISSETVTLPSELQATHFLDLNEVRLAFSADKLLGRGEWHSDPEIKAHNTAPHVTPYAKDYDAILKLKDGNGQEFLIGIEYERTFKDFRRYEEIAQSIETETQLCCVLYIAASIDLVGRLGESIRCQKFPLCVTAAGVLKQQTLDVTVGYMVGNNLRLCTLRQYLVALKHPL
jgi:hypothetical protein